RGRYRLAIALTALFAVGASAQAPPRPATEKADPFVGTWALNLSKSTYENQPTPKSGMRTFDYERDGLILVTAHTVTAAGATTFVHNLFTLDGKEYEEMARGAGGCFSSTRRHTTSYGDWSSDVCSSDLQSRRRRGRQPRRARRARLRVARGPAQAMPAARRHGAEERRRARARAAGDVEGGGARRGKM